MLRGEVKFFNDPKGYGFIRVEGIPEDIFVHHTAIKMSGHRTLTDGEFVDFRMTRDDKGMKAVDVTPVQSSDAPPAEPENAPPEPEPAPQTSA